jgi:protein-S-isoprenylcysteine O-methyltransferase Ste14
MIVLALLALFCLTRSEWASKHLILADVELIVGLMLVVVATVGRMWGSLYIAGYKDKQVLQCGPYSMCRHPLYFFSFLGAMGVACASLTITLPLVVGVGFVLGYQSIMRAEEAFLTGKFGGAYTDYCASIPQFFPDPGKLVHAEKWETNPRIFFRHLGSVVWFVPLVGLVVLLRHVAEIMHVGGVLILP